MFYTFCTLGDLSNDMLMLIIALRMQPISAFISNTACISFARSGADCFGDLDHLVPGFFLGPLRSCMTIPLFS